MVGKLGVPTEGKIDLRQRFRKMKLGASVQPDSVALRTWARDETMREVGINR